jgi:Uma2 family endonuclease
MTDLALPLSPQVMTLDEYGALPEDNSVRCELQEGILMVTGRPSNRHQRAMSRLLLRLSPHLPRDWLVLTESAVVVVAGEPATVRIPDLVVVREPLPDRLLRAAEVALAIEIISPGSRNLDRVLKAYEYAQAGIPQYWVVDLEEPNIVVFTLGPEGYTAGEPVTEELRATLDLDGPVELVVDVTALAGDNSG